VLALDPADADAIGEGVGRWPAYPDAPEALKAMMAAVPCVAMTNSDREHGAQVQQASASRSRLDLRRGRALLQARPGFWHEVTRRLGVEMGPWWWHVSAYADYDLEAANQLGLTTVFVVRPHARTGPAVYRVSDLSELVSLVTAASLA